jgi:hypothetical protein
MATERMLTFFDDATGKAEAVILTTTREPVTLAAEGYTAPPVHDYRISATGEALHPAHKGKFKTKSGRTLRPC